MRNHILSIGVLCATSWASAQDFSVLDVRTVDHFALGVPDKHVGTSTSVAYDNTTSFTGFAITNNAAENQGGNSITKMVPDDCTPNGLTGDVSSFRFSVANFGANPITARARIRFWFADGASGAPGTFYNLPAPVGFTTSPTAFAPGVTVYSASVAPATMTMPTGRFWAGLSFDDNSGSTGASLADLNNLGQGVFDPPSVGASADQFFITYAAGDYFGVNNPAGGLTNFGGFPKGNLGWEFEVVPEPATLVALTIGLAGLGARRRCRLR